MSAACHMDVYGVYETLRGKKQTDVYPYTTVGASSVWDLDGDDDVDDTD